MVEETPPQKGRGLPGTAKLAKGSAQRPAFKAGQELCDPAPWSGTISTFFIPYSNDSVQHSEICSYSRSYSNIILSSDFR